MTKPTQVIVHLGFITNSLTMEVTMTISKSGKIVQLAQQILSSKDSTIRQVARIKGKISASTPANKWAQLQTMNLEIEKNKALAKNKFNHDGKMQLTPLAKEDLKWFIQTIRTSSAPIQIPESDYVIYTDATMDGAAMNRRQEKEGGGGGGGGGWKMGWEWSQPAHKWMVWNYKPFFSDCSLCVQINRVVI